MARLPVPPFARDAQLLARRGDRDDFHGRPAYLAAVAAAAADRLAALVVALLSSFPLAQLFEAGGNTVWGPALLHCVIQGALKVVVVPEAALLPAQLGWMAASVVVPYLAFLVRRTDAARQPPESAPRAADRRRVDRHQYGHILLIERGDL